MTVGLSTTNLANAWLNTIRGGGVGTSYTAPTGQFVKLHTADPGAAGATAPAAGSTTRIAVTLAAAAAGSTGAISSTPPVWTNGGTTEVLTHISVWDAVTAGNFLYSVQLTSPASWVSGNTFTLTALAVVLSPLAA